MPRRTTTNHVAERTARTTRPLSERATCERAPSDAGLEWAGTRSEPGSEVGQRQLAIAPCRKHPNALEAADAGAGRDLKQLVADAAGEADEHRPEHRTEGTRRPASQAAMQATRYSPNS